MFSVIVLVKFNIFVLFLATGLDSHSNIQSSGFNQQQQQNQYNPHQRIIMTGGYDSQTIRKHPIREEELDSGNITLAATNMNTLSSNIQYHVLDPNRGDSGEDYDDEEDTITDELTDDTNHKSNSNRSNGTHRPLQKLQQQSPNDSCNLSDTNVETSMINKQFIQARIVKTALPGDLSVNHPSGTVQAPAVPLNPPPSNIHQRYNQNSEFNQNFFNSTLNSDNGADDSITISSKVNMSISNNNSKNNVNTNRQFNQNMQSNLGFNRDMYNRFASNTSTFAAGSNTPINTSQNQQNSSILSKSTTNMTNITPLASDLNLNQQSFNESNNTSSGALMSEEKTTSDYENISTSALNDIMRNFNSKQQQQNNASTFSRQNNNTNPIVTSPSRFRAPPPPPGNPFQPAGTSNVKAMISKLGQAQAKPSSSHGNTSLGGAAEYTDTDDAESMMSCQLITSASLLANRDVVKEAKRVVDTASKRQMLPPPMPPPPMPKPKSHAPNILNPRSFMQPIDESTQTITSRNQTMNTGQNQFSQRINIDTSTDVVVETCVDVTKPPPMETMI
jgi:hypothetical protein